MSHLLKLFACLLIPIFSFADEVKVLAFSGSARQGSFNQQLIEEAASYARQAGAKVTILNLKDYPMPFYDADLESKGGLPKEVKKFRDQLLAHDAIIISTPEYNGSMPSILKNALDWASRSETGGPSRQAFKDKVFALMSASPGSGGGKRALSGLTALIQEVGGYCDFFPGFYPQCTSIFCR